MELSKYVHRMENLFSENRLLKAAVVVLTVGFLWCAYSINATKDKIRTVVVPPVLHSKVEISGSWTTDSYVKEYMPYVAALLWNYSHATVRSQFGEILVSFHPSAFEAAKQHLYQLAEQIDKTRASSVFYITKIEHKPEQKMVEVTGNRRLVQQESTQVENTTKTYIVSYLVENGKFWLTSVSEKPPVGSEQKNDKPAELPVPGKASN